VIRLVGELIDNTELEWVRVESLVSLTLDHLATQPESQQLRDILPLEILEALRARRLGCLLFDLSRALAHHTHAHACTHAHVRARAHTHSG
jgi:hypothetical protein